MDKARSTSERSLEELLQAPPLTLASGKIVYPSHLPQADSVSLTLASGR